MVDYLTGMNLSERIKGVMTGANPSMCVAYLGPKWPELLFDGGTLPIGLRVICDVAMHVTPKKALRVGGAPNNKNFRYLPGVELHAKLYLSETGAVVCSANATKGGLATEGRVEDGIFIGPDEQGFQKIAETFAERFKASKKIKQEQIDAAPVRMPGGRRDHTFDKPPTILQALRHDPDFFKGVWFVFPETPTEEEIVNAANKQVNQDGDLAQSVPEKKREHFANWPVKKADWPGHFISVWINGSATSKLSQHRHLKFLKNVNGRNVFVSQKLTWPAHGRQFSDMPQLGKKPDCEAELSNLLKQRPKLAGELRGEILSAVEFGNLLELD